MTAKQFWIQHGFTRICTGGNCYAWERTFKADGAHPVQVLITDYSDQETRSMSEVHNVGLYLEGHGEDFACTFAPNATSAWTWIREQLAIPQ